MMMRDDVRQALEVGLDAGNAARTIDITTVGRHTGQARRLEIVFYRVEGEIFLTGIPAPRPRAWLLNLEAEPHFTFHLKQDIVADLPASAIVISDPAERRRILTPVTEAFNERHGPDSPWPRAVLDEWVEHSPLARVIFDGAD